MWGIIRASRRFLRDRRVMLGCLIALLLSLLSELILYSLILQERIEPGVAVVAAAVGAVGWPLLWGATFAVALCQDEFRSGTVETLLTLPASVRQTMIGLSAAPLMAVYLLYLTAAPALLLNLMLLELRYDHVWLVAGVGIAGALVIAPLTIYACVLAGASARNLGSGFMQALSMAFTGVYVIGLSGMIVYLLLKADLWRNVMLLLFPLAFAPYFISIQKQRNAFDFESWESQTDGVTKRIAGLFAFVRREKGTIFERDEGVSKYRTVEEIRQQNIDGPLTRNPTIRDITATILLLVSPLLLLFVLSGETVLVALMRYVFAVLLGAGVFAAMTGGMREMLDERLSLRLDSLRITLMPMNELTETKEHVASLNAFTALKWVFGAGCVFALMLCWRRPLEFAACAGLFGLAAYIALAVGARAGSAIGLAAKDEMEGLLWCVCVSVLWLIAPVAIAFSSSAFPEAASMPWAANLSPMGVVIRNDPLAFSLFEWALGAASVGGMAALAPLLRRRNHESIVKAWG